MIYPCSRDAAAWKLSVRDSCRHETLKRLLGNSSSLLFFSSCSTAVLLARSRFSFLVMSLSCKGREEQMILGAECMRRLMVGIPRAGCSDMVCHINKC